MKAFLNSDRFLDILPLLLLGFVALTMFGIHKYTDTCENRARYGGALKYDCINGVAYHDRVSIDEPLSPIYNTDGSVATCKQFIDAANERVRLQCPEEIN